MGELRKNFHTGWESFNARQQDERNAWLREELASLTGLYDQIGVIGKQFLQEFAATGCTEAVDLQLSARASFQAHHTKRGFINEILYSTSVLSSAADLFSSRTHEAIHAIQFARSAAAHATPFNAAAKIMLCPRDAVLLEELKERDAFAKQWLLDKMIADDQCAAADQKALEKELQNYAAGILQSLKWSTDQSFLDYYRGKEMGEYETRMVQRHAIEKDILYVRLEAEDIRGIGDSLGLQSLDHATAQIPLTPAQETRLDALNRALGITDEGLLPTLGQALRGQGLDRAGFLATALGKGRNSAPKPPAPPCLPG